MIRRTDIAPAAAAAAVVLAAILGGAFMPLQRMTVGVVLILVWILAALEWSGRLRREELWFGGLILWGAISAVLVGASPLASKETLATWLVAWALWCVLGRGDDRSRSSGLRVLVLGAAIIAAAVLVDAVSTGSVRVGGLLENPNLASALLVPVLPLGFVVFDRTELWRRWSWVVLIAAAVVLTGSRAGFVAVVVVVAVLAPAGRLRMVGILSASGLAVAVLAWRFLSQPDVLAWHRISIWWAVVKIWIARPFTGVGPGCLVEAAGVERILHQDQVGRYQFVVSYAESTPLGLMVQLGSIGFGIALIACLMWWREARRNGVFGSAPVRASLASMAVLALFHDFLTADPVLWWWAVLVGCWERGGRTSSAEDVDDSNGLARAVPALVLVWLTAWGIVTPAFGRLIWRDAEPTRANVERTLRVERWFAQPAGERVRHLMVQDAPWGWETAAEALHWATRGQRVHPGLARRWAELAGVHLRIVADLGGTGHDIDAARQALTRACELDPRLPWHWLERARLERMDGNQRAAVQLILHALAQEPNTVRGWLFLSRLELESGRMEAARTALAEAEERLLLADQPGLNDYERELLFAPSEQHESLRTTLGSP